MEKKKITQSKFLEDIKEYLQANQPEPSCEIKYIIPRTFKEMHGYDCLLTENGARPDETVELMPG